MFQKEVMDDDLGKSRIGHHFTSLGTCLSVVNLSDTKNFSKEFNTNFKLLFVKLKLVRRRILDLSNSEPELLHVNLRNISTDEEIIVAWRKLENIQNNMICSFLLLFIGINSHVA
ncbi:hypothetical protein Tco_1404584 [Tanacetum coccineum]